MEYKSQGADGSRRSKECSRMDSGTSICYIGLPMDI